MIAVITSRRLMSVLVIELPVSFATGVITFTHRTVVAVQRSRVVSMMMRMVELSVAVSRVSVKVVRLLCTFSVRRVCVGGVAHRRWPIIPVIIRMISGSIVAIMLMVRVDVMFVFGVAIHLH